MANPKHIDVLLQGADAWNQWRESNHVEEPDLRDADLSGKDLRGYVFYKTNFSGSDLRGVNFDGTNLIGANLGRTVLIGASFRNALVEESYFTGADLTGANLHRARLPLSYFGHATLINTDLTEATLSAADFRGANLSGAKLNKAALDGAVFIGTDLTNVELNETVLKNSDFTRATCANAKIKAADLGYARFIETDFRGADLSGCSVYGISLWGAKLEGAKQSNLVVTLPGEPVISIDDIELAQFVYLIINNNKISNFINVTTSRAVLLLGRFTPERKQVLLALREELLKRSYIPILFDFEMPEDRDMTETITLLARMSRFIIADLSDPGSVQKELEAIVPSLAIPVQPLLQRLDETIRPYSMFRDNWKYDWVLSLHRYDKMEDLLASLDDKVIAPAETKLIELQKKRSAAMF